MRRELLIAAGVLVPFGVLVVLGFHFSAPEPLPVEPGALPVAVTPPPAPAAAPPAPPIDVVPRPPPPAPPPPAKPVAPAVAPALAAPLAALTPEVHRCFDDARARLKAKVSTTVRFTPTRDGGFAEVSLETTAPDPWLRACVEDVFEEVRYTPAGAETFTPAVHTFSFDPLGD